MKIILDKGFTTISMAGAVKEAIKEFKANYTDEDIARSLLEQSDSYYCIEDVLSVYGEAFNSCERAVFWLRVYVKSFNHILQITGIVDGDLKQEQKPDLKVFTQE